MRNGGGRGRGRGRGGNKVEVEVNHLQTLAVLTSPPSLMP
jgi:hypothetical protein